MANESGAQVEGQRWRGKTAPGLAGLYGRLRLQVAGRPVGTLIVEGTYVVLIPETNGPADATAILSDDETMRKLLKGELNPKMARVSGDRGFATRVILGLQVDSPFKADAGKEELP
jgi:hypothetical protein